MTNTTTEAVERIAAAPWCYASEDISAALRALLAERASWIAAQHYSYIGRDYKKVRASDLEDRAEAAEARVKALEIELKIAIGGCDANHGDSHSPISIDGGKYYFCQECGETMTKAEVKRHSSAAAIRKVPTE